MSESFCVVCGKKLNSEEIHNHYLKELSKKFSKEGFKIIEEGKMPSKFSYEPDLFILDKQNYLASVLEVIVTDNYETGETSVYRKCKKIKEYYNPPEIIVYEPAEYLDKVHLPRTRKYWKKVLGYEPTSYKQIEKYYYEKWKNEGLNVTFWNEEHLKEEQRKKVFKP